MPIEAMPTGFRVELTPSAIDRELATMWKQLGGDDGDEQSGVTRIALGNVVWLGSSRHAPRTRQVFSELIVRYPCRLFMLELLPDDTDEIEAYINARCFLPQDLRREICCEEIHLRFGRSQLQHLPAAVRSLLLPDVPTCFWYYSAQPGIYETIVPVFEQMADRMITEVSWMDDISTGLKGLAESRAATSLAWYRYAPIREQIAAIFDDPHCATMIDRISALRFGWSGTGNSNKRLVHTSLLAGWMASCLDWNAPEITDWPYYYESPAGRVTIEPFQAEPADDQPSRLKSLEILFTTGDRYALHWIGSGTQMERILEGPTTPCSGRPRFVSARVLNDAEALGEALNTRGDRRYFQKAAMRAWPLLRAAHENRVQL